jgi:catalase (peroxidase I)
MMLTTDIAFIHDEEYKKLVYEYASDLEGLGKDFAANWYRLTTSVRTPSWVESNR